MLIAIAAAGFAVRRGSSSSLHAGHGAVRSSAPLMLLRDEDESFMISLQNRIGQVETVDNPEQVYLLIMDSIVPRQRLLINNAPASTVQSLRRQERHIVMVGRHRSIHTHGVQVSVQAVAAHDDGTADVVLRGDRYCKVVAAEVGPGTWSEDLRRIGAQNHPSDWRGQSRPPRRSRASPAEALIGRDARVRWLPLDPPALDQPAGAATNPRSLMRSELLGEMAEEWVDKVRRSGRERFVGQLESILESLGPMPDASLQPNERCLWVAALINPYPKLGLANEVRPSVLMAETLEARLDAVEYALMDSIARLEVGWI